MRWDSMHQLLSFEDTTALIKHGAVLAIAAPPKGLRGLPRGRWMGGTNHYFAGPEGGAKSDRGFFVTDLTEVGGINFHVYHASEVGRILSDTPVNGFSLVVITPASESLREYAASAQSTKAGRKRVVGWVAGSDQDAADAPTPFVIDGRDGKGFDDAVVAAHVALPPGDVATVHVLNPYESRGGSILRFDRLGFDAVECTVDGTPERLVDFLHRQNGGNGRLPLIGDFNGARINTSIRSLDPISGRVDFYRPVFPGIDYQLAKPIENLPRVFAEKAKELPQGPPVFGCTCLVNYLGGGFEGRSVVHPPGPITFGQVAHQLLNQTSIVLTI